MKRRALIICNPGEVDEEDYCRGVYRDMANYKAFLCKPWGGAWLESEIQEMERPGVTKLREAIEDLNSADYTFIVYTGHGWHSTHTNSTWLKLRTGEFLDSCRLRTGARKQTLVLDCCRVPVEETISKQITNALEMRLAKAEASWANCRFRFDAGIERCAPGTIVLHACSHGETAGDHPRHGGRYSGSLIDEATEWADNENGIQLLSVVDAHQRASIRVIIRSGYRQNPDIALSATSPYFPFCVVA